MSEQISQQHSQKHSQQQSNDELTSKTHDNWLNTVKEVYDQNKGKGGFQILFPEYRPDLSRALANYLDLIFFDYRENVMQQLGWDAGDISLDDLTKTLRLKSIKKGLVVHNVEALLSTKTASEREQWLADFFSVKWKNPIVLPLSIYQGETVQGHSHICAIEEFPKESFLMRLAM